jgi:quinoprotein glucose dehydrogenase
LIRSGAGVRDYQKRPGIALRAVATFCSLLWLQGAHGAAGDTDVSDGAASEWRHHGGTLEAQRFSPLDQIRPDNVAELEIAWRWSAANFGPTPERKFIATPIMVDGVLYTTAGMRRAVVAVDPATGETLWVYRLDEGERTSSAPRRNSGRGVAFWENGRGDRRIYVITPGYQLVALSADTGRPIRRFGKDGVVDLRQGLGVDIDRVATRIGSSSPPLVVGDVLVVGAALDVGTRPKSMSNVPAHVRGYDARTGRLKWRFHTIPRPGEAGHETWQDDSWTYTGNAGVWTTMSADEERGLVYLPVEAPTSDYYGGHRPGENLFSSSLVCLDARTGKRRWHQQIVRHDIWDYDNPTAPILMDLEVDGRQIPAVVQLTKQSFAYAYDRVTGEPVWPMVEMPVPGSDVPGEWTAPTQAVPTRPAPYDRQGFSEADLIDFTPELAAEARELVAGYRHGDLFTPPSLVDAPDGTRGTIVLPGALGGANWEGGAYDPVTGTLFVASMTAPSLLALGKDPNSDVAFSGGMGRLPRVQGLPVVKPPYGRITAIDMNTGEHRWMVPNADTPERIAGHPALEGVELGRTGISTRALLLATPTLLFAGEGWNGSPVIRAHDKATGEILAEIEVPASATGLPMSYAVDGRQYVVFAVAGRDAPAELVALALPD